MQVVRPCMSPSYVHLHPACPDLKVHQIAAQPVCRSAAPCAYLAAWSRLQLSAASCAATVCERKGSECAPPSAHPCEPGLPAWAAEGGCRAQEAAKAQQELAEAEFDGYSSDETVRVVMSGNQEPKSVDITEEAIAGGAEARLAFTRTLSLTLFEGCCRVSRKCVLRFTSWQACARRGTAGSVCVLRGCAAVRNGLRVRTAGPVGAGHRGDEGCALQKC